MKTADNAGLLHAWKDHYPLFKGTQQEAIEGVNELIDLEIVTLGEDLRIGVGHKWWRNPNVWSDFCQGKGIGPVI